MSYIVIKVYSFECDDCGAAGEEVVPRRDTNLGSLLRQARSELPVGWTHRGREDYCPKCSEKKAKVRR